MMDNKQIEELMSSMAAHGVTELVLESEGTRLQLRRESPVVQYVTPGECAVPISAAAPAVPATAEDAVPAGNSATGVREILSPMVGTYHPPASRAPQVGTTLKKGEVLCVIEAMKLMNDITMEEDGEIVFLALKDGDMVEYGQVIAHYK